MTLLCDTVFGCMYISHTDGCLYSSNHPETDNTFSQQDRITFSTEHKNKFVETDLYTMLCQKLLFCVVL